MPDCGLDAWNITMLDGLELGYLIPSDDSNPTTVRMTMSYVRIQYYTVLYPAALGWTFQFVGILANRVNRIVWNCTHVGDLWLSMSVNGRIVVASSQSTRMCEGVESDSFATLSATDIDGASGDVLAIISGNNDTVPGYITLDQIIIVMNGTGTTSIESFGGSLCWLIVGGLALSFMLIIIYVKKRKEGQR